VSSESSPPSKEPSPNQCPACGRPFVETKGDPQQTTTQFTHATAVTLVAGHLPEEDQVQFSVGPYQILKKIGQGGMGEVFIAYDTTCGRRIALKRIRSDLLAHKQMHNRFLKEARVTSQLTHPAIIPIYAIHDENDLVYYTMPYVEGDTLKQILRSARTREKQGVLQGETSDSVEGTIPSLIRIFLNICQAVGYAHSKGVLHRDLKPENVIVGKYGEVLILDWGLAKLINKQRTEELNENEGISDPNEKNKSRGMHALTNLGKVVGTISYMAPERAMGSIATVQGDIYSLGVILYQILTLRYPFHRKGLKEFRQTMNLEVIQEPSIIAPHRDVPRVLAQMAMRCLATDPALRYQKVDTLLHDLESYVEGRAEWSLAAELSIDKKTDWEFQENVLIAEHMAITRGMDVSDWVSLMISKVSFDENIKIEVDIKFGEKAHGLGFLLGVPEAAEREHLNDGYTLWLSSDIHPATKLLRSTIEVFHSPDVTIKRHEWHRVRIEKTDRHIHLYLDGQLQFSYLGLLPIVGTHIGILSRDTDFAMSSIKVYAGGQNITVNCLAVPDAFLAHKDYNTALSEYRRIGYSFTGRAEGREALFRAGITLLEQAKTEKGAVREALYEEAFTEFEKLHGTPGAPFEYLGKALTYQALNEQEEELKCYKLALRRYAGHPLLGVLKEQILYRMHESSRYDRHLTYNFILLVIQYLPESMAATSIQKLLNSLERHWEPLFFIEEDPASEVEAPLRNLSFATQLAFWLAKPLALLEIEDLLTTVELNTQIAVGNLYFCLIELGSWKLVEQRLAKSNLDEGAKEFLSIALLANQKTTAEATEKLLQWEKTGNSKAKERIILYVMEKALDEGSVDLVKELVEHFSEADLSLECSQRMLCYQIWADLYQKNWQHAGELLQSYSIEQLSYETSLFHFLYGCWLQVTEGLEIASIHFAGVFNTAHPRSWTLFSHFHNGDIVENQGWYLKSFLWEKRQLYRQASLFYSCAGEEDKATYYKKLAQECYVRPELEF
jgi:serine/threonine-protein kinase